MSFYSQRVRESILPLSIGDSLPKAFEEWTVTGRVHDHGSPDERCQLCAQESLRYHFEIQNSLNNNTLWVGSQCILRFGLSIFEDGRLLSPEDSQRKINRLLEQMRQDSCISALEKLAESESNQILASALEYFKKNKYLSPKQAFVVLWRLKRNKIDHNPSFFKIDLKHKRFKEQLEQMELSRVHVIWPSLTASQRALASRYGHVAPD